MLSLAYQAGWVRDRSVEKFREFLRTFDIRNRPKDQSEKQAFSLWDTTGCHRHRRARASSNSKFRQVDQASSMKHSDLTT